MDIKILKGEELDLEDGKRGIREPFTYYYFHGKYLGLADGEQFNQNIKNQVAIFTEVPDVDGMMYIRPIFSCFEIKVNNIRYNSMILQATNDYIIFRTFDTIEEAEEYAEQFKDLI
jgi:hypothetical protein